MTRPAAIFFDLDNTLFDRQHALRRACDEWVGDRFPRFPDEDRKEFVDEFIERDRWGYTPRENLAVWMKSRLPASEESASRWIKELRLRCLEQVAPDPSISELLNHLSEHTKLGLISNGASRLQRAKLARAGIDEHFSTIVISQEHGRRKPDPKIFQAALSKLGCPSGDALFVGDDPWRDIEGAARVGMKTCWISLGRDYPNEATKPDHVVDHVRELRNNGFGI